MVYILYEVKYILFLIILLIVLRLLSTSKTKASFIGMSLVTAIITYLSGIRCNVGSDFFSYYRMYNFGDFYTLDFQRIIQEKAQFAYLLLMQFSKKISESPYAIFMMVAMIVFIPTMIWIYKYSDNTYEALTIFILLGFLDINNNILKQAVALMFLVWGYEFYLNNKRILFIVFSLLAITFHISSIILVFLMVTSKYIKLTYKRIYLWTAVCVIPVVFYERIVDILIKASPVFERFMIYSTQREISLPFLVTSLLYVLILLYFALRFNNLSQMISEDKMRVNLIILSIPFALASFKYIVVNRMCLLALMQLIVLIPRYIDLFRIKDKAKHVYMNGTMLILMIFFVITILSAGNNRYYDYATHYNEEPSIQWYR